MKLKNISPIFLTNYFNSLKNKQTVYKTIDNHNLSASTIKRIKAVLSSILQSAVELCIIDFNYCKSLKIKGLNSNNSTHISHIQTYNKEIYLKVLSLVRKENIDFKTIIILTLKTGLRKSEVFGLKWENVDFKNNTIEVIETRNYISKIGMIEKGTKNPNSQRKLYISSEVINLLNEYLCQLMLKNNLTYDEMSKKFVFENINFNTITLKFKEWQIKNKIEPVLTFHQLRHTHASLLLSEGVDVKTISNRLGHSSITTTLNIYTHVLDSLNQEAVEKLENIEQK